MEYVSESYGGVKKSNPKQQPKDEGKKSAAKKSSVHLRETAPDEGETNLHDSFPTQSTASVSSDESGYDELASAV